jgi:drug/metabolite transporter (DMT)-like permease
VRWLPAAGLAVAVVAVSFGAPLARLTNAAPLAVAAWRMVLAAALIVPFAWARGGIAPPTGRRGAVALAGVLLGLHFGLWIPSLWLTSVSASVLLVETAPLWVLLASPRFLGVPIRPRNLVSFALAIAGVAVIARGDLELSLRAVLGDLLALGGAAACAGYLVVGKRLRGEMPLERYLAVVYGGAALTLVVAVAVLRVPPMPVDAASWLCLLGLAVVPTLTGHSLLNWALAHLEAYRVNLVMLLEPILATLWAWLFLAQAPPAHVLPGGALVLAALALEFLWERVAPTRS